MHARIKVGFVFVELGIDHALHDFQILFFFSSMARSPSFRVSRRAEMAAPILLTTAVDGKIAGSRSGLGCSCLTARCVEI